MPKTYLGKDVMEAAEERISIALDHCPRAYIAFSAGKDSTVLLHMVMKEIIARKRRVGLVFIDLEGQYKLTIDHALECYEMYKEHIDPYWIALPMHLRNAVSVYDPFWVCWDRSCEEAWIREPPEIAITSDDAFPFFEPGMEFEEFVPLFGDWYGEGGPCACFVGIRTAESLNRWRAIATDKKAHLKPYLWTTWVTSDTLNVYPIYDWSTEDVWTYHGKEPDLPYNKLYDMMYKAGLSIHQMRICQPYGDDQRRGLWLYHLIEPETWARAVARVGGANAGALYIRHSGNVTGYRRVSCPEGHTYQTFAAMLLESMPPKTREHFRIKINLWRAWWADRGYPEGIPDKVDYAIETARKAPPWRRVVKALLRNDYWCKGLGFSQHKSHAYEKYARRMKNKQRAWTLCPMAQLNLDLGPSRQQSGASVSRSSC